MLRDETDFFENGSIGDWFFCNNDGYIGVQLHAAEDGFALIPLRHDPARGEAQHPIWQWDGNRESPTLTPSILHHSRTEWHGYLRAGKLVPA